MKTFRGEARLPNLHKLRTGLLSIPASNADSERELLMLRKIQIDKRASLKHTIVNLISIKFNIDFCCHNTELQGTVE